MSKKKVKTTSSPGYRQFMSGFASYAKENGIHIHGGRGSFAKKAGEVWKDLKGKPTWKENLGVVLPQYLEEVEGFGQIPHLTPEFRQKKIIAELGPNQFEWWTIKSLYGLWHENINVYPTKDHLFVVDPDRNIFDISTDEDTFIFYRMLKDSVDNALIDSYSFITFFDSEINDEDGVDLLFIVHESTEYQIQLHDKPTFDWSKQVKERYSLQKEAIGDKGIGKLSQIRVNIKGAAERESRTTSPEDTGVVQKSTEKLKELNLAINRLEQQYKDGIINRADYRKALNKLYKL